MKLLLLQLSDIHVRAFSDPVLARANDIVTAITNIDYDLEACFIILSGDMTFSGAPDQFVWVSGFLADIEEGIKKAFPTIKLIRFIPVPGNHDCLQLESQLARKQIVEGAPKALETGDLHYISYCLSVQDNFFDFKEAIAPSSSDSLHQPPLNLLMYSYRFVLSDNYSVHFNCCNTSWLSRKDEEQGELMFPPHLYSGNVPPASLLVTLFHHPYNWLQPENSREFRRKVERVSDLIFTGHEHDGESRGSFNAEGQLSHYFEGGALADRAGSAMSCFNAVLVDLSASKQKFAHFSWEGESYSRTSRSVSGEDGAGLKWHDFQGNRLRTREQFEISEDMRKTLEEPGFPHDYGSFKLSHFYIFPQLKAMDSYKGQIYRTIPSESCIDKLNNSPKLLITGDDQSGKSSLARMLFLRAHAAGYIPVLIECFGRKLPITDKLFGRIEGLFTEQYSNQALEKYRTTTREKRLVIFDDYHRLLNPSHERSLLLEMTSKFSGNVIIFGDAIETPIELAATAGNQNNPLREFQHCRILPFGRVLRNALIEKWANYMLERSRSLDLAHFVQQTNQTVNSVLGKNFVPAYPVFIVSLLQQVQETMERGLKSLNIGASTFGYYYELLIRTALLRGKSQSEFDVIIGYLSFFAYSIFESRMSKFSNDDFLRIHEKYYQAYGIRLSPTETLDQLVRWGIFRRDSGDLFFRYRFVYYYFVASYLKDNLKKNAVRAEISTLCANVYSEESANILLFLVHLSKDAFILDSLLSSASGHYGDANPAQMADECLFIKRLGIVGSKVEMPDEDPDELRKRHLKELDAAGIHDPIDDVPVVAPRDSCVFADYSPERLVAAIHTCKILGQILKNFPGTIEVESKNRLVEECYAVMMRALGFWLTWIDKNKGHIMKELRSLARNELDSDKVINADIAAIGFIASTASLISYGLILSLSRSLGTSDLDSGNTTAVLTRVGTCAADLVKLGIRLGRAGDCPEGTIVELAKSVRSNPLVFSVLQSLVANHLTQFKVEFRKRQAICSALDMSLRTVQGQEYVKGILT